MTCPISTETLHMLTNYALSLPHQGFEDDTKSRIATTIIPNKEYTGAVLTNSVVLRQAAILQHERRNEVDTWLGYAMLNNVPPDPYTDDENYTQSNGYNRFSQSKLLNWIGHVLGDTVNPFTLTSEHEEELWMDPQAFESPSSLNAKELAAINSVLTVVNATPSEGHHPVVIFNQETLTDLRIETEVVGCYNLDEISENTFNTL